MSILEGLTRCKGVSARSRKGRISSSNLDPDKNNTSDIVGPNQA